MALIKDKAVSEKNPMPFELVTSGEVIALFTIQAGLAVSTAFNTQNIQNAIMVTTTATSIVDIEVSLDGLEWAVGATSTLLAAGSDAIIINAPWKFVRANITASTGLTTVKVGV